MWRVMEVRLRRGWRERVRGGINQTYGGLAGWRDPPPTSTLHCSTSLTWWLGRWAMERGQRGVSVSRERRSLMGRSKVQGVSTAHVRQVKFIQDELKLHWSENNVRYHCHIDANTPIGINEISVPMGLISGTWIEFTWKTNTNFVGWHIVPGNVTINYTIVKAVWKPFMLLIQ